MTTIRPGNTWGDDFALYILHAKNIALCNSYARTGYIYNPAVPIYGPPSYPPVFPALLAPIYRLWGVNFWAMKCEQVVFFILALVTIYACLLRYTSAANASLVIGILGFNPHFWTAKDNILSDLPFLFFFWLAIWLASRWSRSYRWSILLGVVLYLAAGTRIVGVKLLAGFLIYELLTRRKLTGSALIPSAICLAALAAQSRIMALGQGSSFDLFHPTRASVLGNIFAYTRALATLWMGGSKTTFGLVLVAITAALACVGVSIRARRKPGLLEINLAFYVISVVVWPGRPGLRLLYPVIPFYVYLIVAGLAFLRARSTKFHVQTAATAVFLLIFGVAYISVYRQSNWHAIPETDGLPSFNDLCRRVQQGTLSHEVFVCRRPRSLTLFTRRPAAVYDSASDADFWRFAQRIHAAYVLCNRQEPQDTDFLRPLISRSGFNLEIAYQNSDFELYRIRSYDVALLKRDAKPGANPDRASQP